MSPSRLSGFFQGPEEGREEPSQPCQIPAGLLGSSPPYQWMVLIQPPPLHDKVASSCIQCLSLPTSALSETETFGVQEQRGRCRVLGIWAFLRGPGASELSALSLGALLVCPTLLTLCVFPQGRLDSPCPLTSSWAPWALLLPSLCLMQRAPNSSSFPTETGTM